MKLASRMTAVIGSCAALLIGASGWLQLRSEERDLRAVAESEARLLARTLQSAFKNAVRDRKLEDVIGTLRALAQVEPEVAIFVFDEDGQLVGASRDARPSAETRRIELRARRESEPVLEYLPARAPRQLLLGRRLREEEPASASAIVLEKPLTELQRDLRETRRNIWLTTSLLVLSVAALTWWLSVRYVGVPLGQLVTSMRQVRAGDLRISPGPGRSDEVGEALEEFERLVHALDAARRRADEAFEAQRRMERGLQDADKLITLGQLSAVMAHEIGSPLQILEGRARALKRHAGDAAATLRTADLLVQQTERITRIVKQMLSITRRRPPRRAAAVDAESSIRSVVALLELEARRRQIEIAVERTGRTDVFADADQLQQVVLNLLRNALEAAPPETTVRVRVGGDEEQLVLEVLDAGPGVRGPARAHLFEPFFTTKGESGGSGLGLSVVRSIVLEHGGHVGFVDADQPGCVVRLALPRRAEAAAS